MNPLAQTFFVQSSQFPNGMFLASLDLCFKSKATVLPVSVQIRPTNNGYPSGSVILPFSDVSLLPNKVNITASPNFTTVSRYTRFTFPTPVYLTPGEYAIIVWSNDPDYEIYTANLGGTVIGGTRIVSKQPYSGVFFKSSNALTYTPYQDIDLMFRLNKCVFTPLVEKTVTFVNEDADANVAMDSIYIQAQSMTYGVSSLLWSHKTTPNSTGTLSSSYAPIQVNQTNSFDDGIGRRKIWDTPSGNNGKYFLKASLLTHDPNLSPVIDTERMSINAVANQINNDAGDETGTYGGNALTRYISRRVTLADGFDATCINVYLTAYKPLNTNILVYVKVLSRDDPDTFDEKNWILLEQISSSSLYSTNENDPKEFKYAYSENDDSISYDTADATYTSFATYAVKIVYLSSDTTIYPICYDMRAIALPK